MGYQGRTKPGFSPCYRCYNCWDGYGDCLAPIKDPLDHPKPEAEPKFTPLTRQDAYVIWLEAAFCYSALALGLWLLSR